MNQIRRQTRHWMIIVFLAIGGMLTTQAQTIAEELQADARRAAGTYYALPITETEEDTPAPDGKRPCYISHYGCSAPYYLEQAAYYDKPYATLAKADSLGKLTALGIDVLYRLSLLREDAHDRTGELTEKGVQQIRAIIDNMARRFPGMFANKSLIDGRSIVLNHCIQTLNEAMVELAQYCPTMSMTLKTSHRDISWMNPQDKELTSHRTNPQLLARYEAFANRNTDETHLMELLFNDLSYVDSNVNAKELSQQLFNLAGSIQHTSLSDEISLYELFTPEEIRRHWRKQNAWKYINYGNCEMNGGQQPFLQRAPLWNMLHMGDSIMKADNHIIHLRYTNENVVMSLACLMELDNCGVRTANLDSIETLGWADYRIAPLGGSIQLIHYRRDINDNDILVKVLFNGHEARLPVQTDCAPYYHWKDMKHYYLRKLYRYAKIRLEGDDKKETK